MNVLLVNDNQELLKQLKSDLISIMNNATICIAVNGFVALELLKDRDFDVAVVSIKMSMMNGVSFITASREFCDIPMILYPAKADGISKNVLKSLVVHKIMSKSCGIHTLALEIGNAVEKRNRARAIQKMEAVGEQISLSRLI